SINPSYSGLCFSKESCLLGFQVWDTSAILPDNKFPGIILKSLFGYRDQLFLGQAIAYTLFLMIVGGTYLQSLRGKSLVVKKIKPSPGEAN
ncbi:MAG: hypothetical protein ACOC3E_00650, partial [Cyanobacteriota bacterium]